MSMEEFNSGRWRESVISWTFQFETKTEYTARNIYILVTRDSTNLIYEENLRECTIVSAIRQVDA